MKWIQESSGQNSFDMNFGASKSFLEAVAVVVAAALFGFYVLMPQAQKLSEARDSIDRLQTYQKALEDQQGKLAKITKSLQDNKLNIQRLDRLVPVTEEPASLYHLVEQLAASSGLSGVNVEVNTDPDVVVAAVSGSGSGKRVLKEVSLEVKGVGSIEQLQGFIKLLENSGRIMHLRGLEVSSTQNSNLIFTLPATAYAYASTLEDQQGAR